MNQGDNGNGNGGAPGTGTAAPKRGPRGRKRPPDDLLFEAIEKTAGLTTQLAKLLHVDPSTVLRWRKIPKIARVFERVEREKVDLAESKVLQGMKNGNVAFTIFYLKCKGGWREKTEVGLTIDPQDQVREETEIAKRIILSAAGADLINRLLAIASGREPGADSAPEPGRPGALPH
jgi:hypothetical protein